jgi:hypothetical protein
MSDAASGAVGGQKGSGYLFWLSHIEYIIPWPARLEFSLGHGQSSRVIVWKFDTCLGPRTIG